MNGVDEIGVTFAIVTVVWWAVAMTDWAGLRDASGSAEAVPGLLAVAANETHWGAKVWEDLWSRLYHQGLVYPASHEAVPMLVDIAKARREVAVDPALFLAASILSAIDEARGRATDPGLVDLTTHKLSLVAGRADVLYALQCVAAVEGLTAWFDPLAGLAGGEVEVDCGVCGDHVYVEVHDDGMFSTEFPDNTLGRPVIPTTEDQLGVGAARLFALARDQGHEAVAAQLLSLFGQVECPTCSAFFHLGDQVDSPE